MTSKTYSLVENSSFQAVIQQCADNDDTFHIIISRRARYIHDVRIRKYSETNICVTSDYPFSEMVMVNWDVC